MIFKGDRKGYRKNIGGVRWYNANIQLGDMPKMRKESLHKVAG